MLGRFWKTNSIARTQGRSINFARNNIPVCASSLDRRFGPGAEREALSINSAGFALNGNKIKCVAVDCDGTLWKGVIGEDGLAGIMVTPEHAAFQQALKDLKAKGFLLAICSKNNLFDVEEALEKHPDMILRKSDFVAIQANWEDKASNIRALAKWLNLSEDTFLFFDDRPQERLLVRSSCPNVVTPDWPSYPEEFSRLLAGLEVLCQKPVTEEDKRRTEFYQAKKARENLMANCTSIEDSHRALKMEVTVRIKEANREHLSRIAQLSERTTQFNMTGQKYNVCQLNELIYGQGNSYNIYSLELSDVFGNEGIVGAAIIRLARHFQFEPFHQIEAFFLSCRAIGFNLERAFMAAIIDDLRKGCASKLGATFTPTNRNLLFKDFYESIGFISGEGAYKPWLIKDLSKNVQFPDWITVNIQQPDYNDMAPHRLRHEASVKESPSLSFSGVKNKAEGEMVKVKYITCADKDSFVASKHIQIVRIENLGCAGHTGDGEPIYGYNVYYYEKE